MRIKNIIRRMRNLSPLPWGGVGVLLALLSLTACNEDPEYYELKTYPDEMHIRSSVEEITLNKGIASEGAVTFTWDKATSPVSPDDVVTYKFRFYASSTKNENYTDYYDCGTDQQITFTHDELNSIVARWALPGQPVRITAQVLSIVNNESKYVKPESSTVELTVTGYEKYPQYLYMVMTDEETGNITTQRLEQRQLGTGVYEVTTNMSPCTYHFTTTGDEYPAYGQAEGETMTYITEGSIPEFTYSGLIGTRTIIVDTNEDYNDCRVLEIVKLPTDGLLWIAGNGCSVGWNTNTAAGRFTMTGDVRSPYIYSWTGEFIAGGEFKIGLGAGWGDNFFFAPEANADPLTDNRLLMYRTEGSGGDLKWVPSVSGRYTLTVYLKADDMHLTFEPAQ